MPGELHLVMPFVDGYIQNTHAFRAYSFHQKFFLACYDGVPAMESEGKRMGQPAGLCFLHPVHHGKRNFLRLPFIPSDYPQRLITSALPLKIRETQLDYPQRLITSALPLKSRETQLFFYVGLPYIYIYIYIYIFFFFPPT